MPLTLGVNLDLGGNATSFPDFQSGIQQTFSDRNSLSTDKLLGGVDSTTGSPSLGEGSFTFPSASSTDLATTNNFTSLRTMDTYKVQTQGAYLTGLLASKQPLLPMTFNAVLPDINASGFFQQYTDSFLNPLTLFINPKTWTRSTTKKNTNTFTRGGYKSERWGEELEQIDASGEIGAFYTQQTGLTRINRSQTPSYRNFLQLIQMFKNNGCYYSNTYDGANLGATKSARIVNVGYIEVLYGHEYFRGTFDSLSVKESADSPFSLSYSFTFYVGEVVSIYDATALTTSANVPTGSGTGDFNQFVQDVYQNVSADQASAGTQGLNPASTLDNPTNANTLQLNNYSTGGVTLTPFTET